MHFDWKKIKKKSFICQGVLIKFHATPVIRYLFLHIPGLINQKNHNENNTIQRSNCRSNE